MDETLLPAALREGDAIAQENDAKARPIATPFTGETIAHVSELGPDGVDVVADRAQKAFREMRALSSYRRAEILHGIAERIRNDHARFSTVLALEAGKPLKLARGEVDRAIQTFTVAAEEAKRLGGEVLPLDVTAASERLEGSYRRFPVGPVLGISPFNFPLNLVAHKVAPALAVGASIVLKPAPQTPLSALMLAVVAIAAGAPLHALQVVPATVEAAELLVRDPRFALLSFTGSDRVGFHLKSICGKKRALLELGGNAAAIVHADAKDLGFAATQLAASAFGYAGQVCIKTQRILVHESVAKFFIEKFLTATRALTIARDEKDEMSLVGPLIDEKAAQRVESWVQEARGRTDGDARASANGDARASANGDARANTDGTASTRVEVLLEGKRTGNYLEPTVLRVTGDTAGLKVVEEEVFGPVAIIQIYTKLEDAIASVNASRYGLQAAIFTDSLTRVREAYEQLEVGGLIVNDATNVRVDLMPYGGVKDSGAGREGLKFAMQEMTEPKMLVVRR